MNAAEGGQSADNISRAPARRHRPFRPDCNNQTRGNSRRREMIHRRVRSGAPGPWRSAGPTKRNLTRRRGGSSERDLRVSASPRKAKAVGERDDDGNRGQKRAAPRLSTGAAPLSGGPSRRSAPSGFWRGCRIGPRPDPRVRHPAPFGLRATGFRPPTPRNSNVLRFSPPISPTGQAQPVRPFPHVPAPLIGSPARLPGVPEMTVVLHSEPMIRVPPKPVKSLDSGIFSQA